MIKIKHYPFYLNSNCVQIENNKEIIFNQEFILYFLYLIFKKILSKILKIIFNILLIFIFILYKNIELF